LELHKLNASVELATQRLWDLVPLLKFINCTVSYIGADKTVLTVPLLETAMNQNGTQQAAIFYLIADYTLGIGMFGALPGVCVTGVHDRCRGLPVQYWLKRGSVQHLAPGTGTMKAEVTILPEDALELRKQLIARGRCELTETVRIYQGEQLVATTEYTMGLYADLPRLAGVRANIFQIQNSKTSAMMIAGLRGDGLSLRIAQEQGVSIANRMALAAPQLPTLVKARSMHIEQYLSQKGLQHEQVLVIGVGFNPKPIQFSSPTQKWFGVDLQQMLRERDSRFADLGIFASNYVGVVGDLRLEKWGEALLNAGFSPHKSTFIIMEGISMYFSKENLEGIIKNLRILTLNEHSRFWLDHVTSKIFTLDRFDVQSFLASIARACLTRFRSKAG